MSVNHILEISIRDYYKHSKICTVKDIDHHATCPDCSGTGYKDKYDHTCPYCSGKRRVLFGLFTCPSCDGKGKIYTSPANICKHKGSTIYYTCNITQEEANNGVCKDINIYGDIYHVYTR